MGTNFIALFGLACFSGGILCSCATTGGDNAAPLQAGTKPESHATRPADTDAKPARNTSPYLFTLDAANPASPSLPTVDGNPCVRTTAYCHDESDHLRYGHLAAAGAPLRFGAVCSAAADWSRYPVGTTFRIKSQPDVVYEVDDYGSALVGSDTIDLYRPTMGSMNAWGVRDVEIEIVKWGSFYDSLRIMRNGVHYPHVRRMYQDIQRRLDQAGPASPANPPPVTVAKTPVTAA